MTGLTTDIARRIMEIFHTLEGFLRLYQLPKAVDAVFTFFNRNMDRTTEEQLNEVTWKKETTIETVTDYTVSVVWLVLSLAKEVNTIRHAYGRVKIDFIQEAMNYDQAQASQQQGQEADQEGEDGGVPETVGP